LTRWAARLGLALLIAFALLTFGRVHASSPSDDLSSLVVQVDAATSRLQSGDLAGARAAYQAFDNGWYDIEDGIRDVSRAHYRAIEDAMGDAKYALTSDPVDQGRALEALQRLRSECDSFISEVSAGSPSPASAPSPVAEPASVQGLLTTVDGALARLDAGDTSGAIAELNEFRYAWTDVEGLVKVRSAAAYTRIENNMAKAAAQLASRPPDVAAARQTLGEMRADLSEVASSGSHYGVPDAAIILLREGLEALLVVGALLTFLQRMGHGDKSRWIWLGCAAAIAASVLVAAVVNVIFARAGGSNRELLEGVTGLVAAAMLIYMSYWLHSKASLGAWHHYIQQKGTAALSSNSLFSLAFLAFLAVFREGAETVLFYAGIAPSIALGDLALGLALGVVGLVAVGVAMFALGVRLPLRPFFAAATVLIYYLAFKFVGTGIHALQVAGVLQATTAPYLPEIGALGVYPTWETTAAQLLLVMVSVAALVAERVRRAPNVDLVRKPSAAG